MNYIVPIIILFTLLLMSFQSDKLKIEIISSQILDEVPSASGIVKCNDNYYLIGDDSPYLFKLDQNFNLDSKIAIHSTELLEGEKIKKADKPDFEALEMIDNNELIVLGSGSKSPQRDVFLTVLLNETPTIDTYNITSFYTELKELPILDHHELNIEGVAVYNNYIYLLNRGKNIVFSWPYQDLLNYFKGTIPFPNPKATLFSLPKINGIESGFSGATAFINKPYLIFTSSVENTDNAYDDGEILGSFVGIIPIDNNHVSETYDNVEIPNETTKLKVESVTIEKEISETETELIFTTDNDGGKSSIIKCRIKY